MHTIIDLPEQDRNQLDAYCREQGISRAEAMRKALRLCLKHQEPKHHQVFGLWRDRPEDTLNIQHAHRQNGRGGDDGARH